eukprot:13031594-Alexandrium_andersonii.AAC.1
MANRMVARVCILLYIMLSLNVFVIVEQPKGSLMQYHEHLEAIYVRFGFFRHSIAMGHYGAESEKPTWLYSNKKIIGDIDMCRTT